MPTDTEQDLVDNDTERSQERNQAMLKPEEKWRFSCCQLFGILLGGVCEFGTSLCSILAFGKAASNGINAGVAGVLIPLSGVIVSIASYFLFGERLQIV